MATAPESKIVMLALAVATGSTVKDWAESNGVPERTAYGWASRPAFKRRVRRHRAEAVEQCIGTLAKVMNGAAVTMWDLLSQDYPPGIRLSAAKAIHASMVELQTHADLAERIKAIEETLAAAPTPTPHGSRNGRKTR